jgi:hypothetical protein
MYKIMDSVGWFRIGPGHPEKSHLSDTCSFNVSNPCCTSFGPVVRPRKICGLLKRRVFQPVQNFIPEFRTLLFSSELFSPTTTPPVLSSEINSTVTVFAGLRVLSTSVVKKNTTQYVANCPKEVKMWPVVREFQATIWMVRVAIS